MVTFTAMENCISVPNRLDIPKVALNVLMKNSSHDDMGLEEV